MAPTCFTIPLKRAAVGKTYPAVEETSPAVGTFFHGILFSRPAPRFNGPPPR